MTSKRLEISDCPVEGDFVLDMDAESNGVEDSSISADATIKELTKEDIESKKYALSDVILPLPGFKVKIPAFMKEHYQNFYVELGLPATYDFNHVTKFVSFIFK